MWQKSKLHSTWVHSLYGTAEALTAPAESRFVSRSGFCDLQPVIGCAAKDTYALLHKQLKSVGCPPPQKEASGGDVVGIAEEVSPCLRSYLYCSDGGSDQSKYKKMVAFILRESKYQFFVSISCTLHAQQLVVKDTFVYLDHWCGRMNKKWKYFPSLAKLIYVWRDNATQCLAIWRKLYGDLSAAQHGFKLPAKAIAGRWGSVFACHRDLLGNLGAMGI